MILRAQQRDALLRALHSTWGARERWAARDRLDDETLRLRIGEEFGIQGGFGTASERMMFWGGANPRIEIQVGDETPLTLSGRELLSSVREALNIGRPDELF